MRKPPLLPAAAADLGMGTSPRYVLFRWIPLRCLHCFQRWQQQFLHSHRDSGAMDCLGTRSAWQFATNAVATAESSCRTPKRDSSERTVARGRCPCPYRQRRRKERGLRINKEGHAFLSRNEKISMKMLEKKNQMQRLRSVTSTSLITTIPFGGIETRLCVDRNTKRSKGLMTLSHCKGLQSLIIYTK